MAGDSKIDLAGLSRRTIGDRSSIVGMRACKRVWARRCPVRLVTNFAVDLANDLSFSLGVVRRSFGVTDRSFASNGKACINYTVLLAHMKNNSDCSF